MGHGGIRKVTKNKKCKEKKKNLFFLSFVSTFFLLFPLPRPPCTPPISLFLPLNLSFPPLSFPFPPSFPCRAPNPDYSLSVYEKRKVNIERAKLVFKDLMESDVPLDVISLTTYMTGM